MQKLFYTLLLTISIVKANDISINITDIKNQNGKVLIGLYNTNKNFTEIKNVYKGISLDIKSNNLKYIFKNIPNGIYAIAVVHDENQNKIHDTNFFGIPIEGYGFSNNIRHQFSSATFDESKLTITKNQIINIKMWY